MLNEQWLNTFLTLVEVEHFTLTADKLNMTQPGVSQHVKKLEEQVGRALLNRAGKKFELTQAGEMLYSYALKRIKEEEELFNQLEVDSEEEGPCKFSCSGAMATVLYPHFLKRQKKFPGLVVSVEAAPNKLIIDKVISNEIDVGIVTQSTVLSELSYESVGVEALCLVLPKKYSNKKLNFS
ncbi:MAG: LysR family transcriptional regulator, partial [Bacteriovoracaceae bacterium]|nr:LysR family transcriptional regulator [Bacteriovoracaceae bacterium]